jgi:Domain of unknown function (DUF4157)
MEPRFGQDFSHVRVHTDARAAESARAVNAQAYTLGSEIVFGPGKYSPQFPHGRKLMAHELAHVAQQRGSRQESLSTQLCIGKADDQWEHEANRSADTVIGTARSIPGMPLGLKPPGWMIQRDKGGGDKAQPAPSWTVDELKKMLDACDGGLGIWAKAKKANKDKDPKIVPGSGGQVDTMTGEITLDKTQDKCFAVQQLIQELSNLSRGPDINKLQESARAGDVSREDLIKQWERFEYETGVKNVLKAFDACKDKWPCKTTPKEWARKAKDFEDYFKNFLSPVHKEHYGKWWDTACKPAYDKKHAKK